MFLVGNNQPIWGIGVHPSGCTYVDAMLENIVSYHTNARFKAAILKAAICLALVVIALLLLSRILGRF